MLKKPVRLILIALAAFLVFVPLHGYLSSRNCARMVICISNLKQLGLALNMYACDYQGKFPTDLSLLYPGYVSNLTTFLCPIKAYTSRLNEQDVLKNFTVCYEYIPGLTREDDNGILIVFDRKDNHAHIFGHHRDSRNAAFVGGRVQAFNPLIPSTNRQSWEQVWATHQKLLQERSHKSQP